MCNNDFVSPSTALGQGLQVASPTQSPNTFPPGMITTYSPEPLAQSGGGQLRTSGVAVTQAAPAPSTPPVGMVANVLQHQLASPGGFARLLSAGFWTNTSGLPYCRITSWKSFGLAHYQQVPGFCIKKINKMKNKLCRTKL